VGKGVQVLLGGGQAPGETLLGEVDQREVCTFVLSSELFQ